MSSPSHCWYLRAQVGDLQVDFLIDSGSQPNLMDQKVYDALPVESRGLLRVSNTRLYGASGSEIDVSGETTVKLQVGQEELELPVIVASLNGAQGILGMDFLSGNECSLNLYHGYLDSKNARHSLQRLLPNRCNYLYLSHPTIVPNGDVVTVKCVLDKDVMGSDPTIEWEIEKKLLQETGLHPVERQTDVRNRGEVHIKLMNLGGEQVELPAGKIMGQVVEETAS